MRQQPKTRRALFARNRDTLIEGGVPRTIAEALARDLAASGYAVGRILSPPSCALAGPRANHHTEEDRR